MASKIQSPDRAGEQAGRHSARFPWLNRQSFRLKLALIVGVPSVVALIGAAALATERGFTSAALSDPAAQAARQASGGLRAEGDRLLDAALAEAQPALHGNAVLSTAHHQLLEARRARDARRAEVDADLARRERIDQARVQRWFDAQTRLILAERIFGGTLFLAQNPYELVIQYNGYIKGNVFVASEFAGRERARIGRIIASGKPIPPDGLDELQRWRGVVDENLAAIAQLRANPAMSGSVLESIGHMEDVFLGDYENVRQSVYGAAARGEAYPLTTDEWIAASTRGIDSILAVSDRIGEEAARISRQEAEFNLANVLLLAGMIALLLLAVVASVFVARHLTRRLGELRAAAERVSQGNYSQPVNDAGAPGTARDEFAALAGVFNAMQAKVEAGIEQLQAEKAGVEARVRERTRELSEANERLVALNAEKDTFLGICSHDLKNPLNGIAGMAGLIVVDAGDAAQVRSHAADILQSSEYMSHLVHNLLDINAIEQGKFNLDPELLDLAATVSRVADGYRRRAADKRIRLDLALPPDEVTVRADARALRQVADNLVSNAVKFTPPGGAVEVRVERRDGRVRFSVRDTGPGLSAEERGRVFEKYPRRWARTTGGESSTGLGLSIVKRLAEASGGTVDCRSELGRGSTFSVELPAAPAVS